KFTGMRRRFQIIGEHKNAKIVDDYAHHPTEIEATLKTARNIISSQGEGRIIAVFQPHRYSRFSTFWNDFKQCFTNADELYVCDVYSASEKPVENVNSENFAREIDHKMACYVKGNLEEVAEKVYPNIKPYDIVLTLGAGNITKLGNILIEKINTK
ncbi:MAG: cyanophycin synthetase, partial [Cyanobacteriota bacterium]